MPAKFTKSKIKFLEKRKTTGKFRKIPKISKNPEDFQKSRRFPKNKNPEDFQKTKISKISKKQKFRKFPGKFPAETLEIR